MKRFSLKFFLMLLVCLITNDICSAQGQWQQIGENGLVATNAMDQSLSFDNEGTPYVAYQDKANNYKATVKKFDGSNWISVGEAGISNGFVKGISIVLDGNNTPYISYVDNGNDGKGVIKKFNGDKWVNVGSSNFPVEYASGISLSVDSKGNPIVAFQNREKEGKANVKKFNGRNWVSVGPANFTRSYANNISLVLDGNDLPYVSFTDEAYGGKASVKRYNGKKWEDLSSNGLPDNYATGLSIALDGNGTPFLVFRDETNDYKISVKRYSNNKWENVGPAGFSDGKINHSKLVVDNNGTPYVAYVDYGKGAIGNLGTVNVRRFDGSVWESVSPADLTTRNSFKNDFDLTLVLDNNGLPHLSHSNKNNGSKATVLKLASANVPNKRPTADAGSNITIKLPNKSLQLQGSGSDEDGKINSYTWKQVSGPNKAKFSNLRDASPTVKGLIAGVYQFSLTTKDNRNSSSYPDVVSITVIESEAPVQKVTSFVLIDAETKKELLNIEDGATIDLALFSTKRFNIRAETNLQVGSVKLELSGEQNKDRVENSAPYNLVSESDSWLPAIGDYTLDATPFEKANAQGDEGDELEINFSVIDNDSDDEAETENPNLPKIVFFTLVNADNGEDLQEIDNGSTINLTELPTDNISIRVNTNTKVGSVKLDLSGKQTKIAIENIAPYALYGGKDNNYNPWTPKEGSYKLKATPYSARGGEGTPGTSLSINFNIIDQIDGIINNTAARKEQDVEKIISNKSVAIYPNPTTSKLHIEINEVGEGVVNINLVDISGREILTQNVNTTSNLTTTLDVDKVNPGIYILVINTPQNRVSKRVVIK